MEGRRQKEGIKGERRMRIKRRGAGRKRKLEGEEKDGRKEGRNIMHALTIKSFS